MRRLTDAELMRLPAAELTEGEQERREAAWERHLEDARLREIARLDEAKAFREALAAAQHFHDWDEATRRCRRCGITKREYHDSRRGNEAGACPAAPRGV